MEAILEICCGLDVHRDNIVACLMKGNLDNKPTSEIRTFPALQHGLKNLKEWIEKAGCHNVAMESTGIYWKPVYTILEEAFDGGIEIILVNAQKIKNVPGRKTDVKDSQWIASLLRSGLLSGSFIPDKEIRELSILCEVAWTVTRRKGTYLASWYWRVKQRSGAKKAIIGLARKILVIIYTLLKQNISYDEDSFEAMKINHEKKREKKLILELQKKGYKVEPLVA